MKTFWSEENHKELVNTHNTLTEVYRRRRTSDKERSRLWELWADICLNNMIREPNNRDYWWQEFGNAIVKARSKDNGV